MNIFKQKYTQSDNYKVAPLLQKTKVVSLDRRTFSMVITEKP
jgi:hypothetical protein